MCFLPHTAFLKLIFGFTMSYKAFSAFKLAPCISIDVAGGYSLQVESYLSTGDYMKLYVNVFRVHQFLPAAFDFSSPAGLLMLMG